MECLLELTWAELDYEEFLTCSFVVTVVTIGHLTHLLRAEGRRKHRQYLCRPELIPNPRIGTSWQCLYESQSDRAFVTTMGIDTTTFQALLHAGFEDLWNSTPIPRTDTSANGNPRLAARSLDAAGGLGLYLHYLRSSMREVGLQLIFALIPSTVNRYLAFARQILLNTLRGYPASSITWFSPDALDEMTNLVQVRCFESNMPSLILLLGPPSETCWRGWDHRRFQDPSRGVTRF